MFEQKQKADIKSLKRELYPVIDSGLADVDRQALPVLDQLVGLLNREAKYPAVTSLVHVVVVDKLYEVMKSEEPKTIPFKFVALFLLKELVKLCDRNLRLLEYLTDKYSDLYKLEQREVVSSKE